MLQSAALGWSVSASGSALLRPLEPLEDRDRVAFANLNDRLLPLPRSARCIAAPLGLGLDRSGAHVEHLYVEQLLDRLTDLSLVGAIVDPERVLTGLGEHERLLGH